MQGGPLAGQRRFCTSVLSQLTGLSYLSFVHTLVPQDEPAWKELLPESDQPVPPPADTSDGAPPDALAEPYSDILAWLKQKLPSGEMLQQLHNSVMAEGGRSAEDALRCFTHTLLDRGKVTPFHTITLLDRYRDLYSELSREVRGAAMNVQCSPIEPTVILSWQC